MDSDRGSRAPPYSGYCYHYIILHIRDCHPMLCAFPCNFYFIYITNIAVLQPHSCLNKNGLGCSRFARRYLGNRFLFLFLRLLRCFSSAGLLPCGFIGCPIRKSAGYRLFAPLRSLSQLITSFFASESLGIPRVLLSFFFIIFL